MNDNRVYRRPVDPTGRTAYCGAAIHVGERWQPIDRFKRYHRNRDKPAYYCRSCDAEHSRAYRKRLTTNDHSHQRRMGRSADLPLCQCGQPIQRTPRGRQTMCNSCRRRRRAERIPYMWKNQCVPAIISGDALRAERVRRRLKQSEAGAQVGVSHVAWHSWERGYSKPRRINAEKLRAWLASPPEAAKRDSMTITIQSLTTSRSVTPLAILQLCERLGWQSVGSEIGVPELRLRSWARGSTRPGIEHEDALARLIGKLS
jgi:hypothetical protein